MRLSLLLTLLLAAPVRAQTPEDFGDATPEAVLAMTWTEALGGAEAVAWALDDVAADTAGAPAEAVGDAGRARAPAAVASAASAATLGAALQFSIALADEAERATVHAALGADAVALHTLLMVVAETVDPPPDDPTLVSAAPEGVPDEAAVSWGAYAGQIRAVAGRLGGAVAALGLASE